MESICIAAAVVPSLVWVAPFAALLLCVSILPLIPKTAHWWEHNRNKLMVGLALGGVALVHYGVRGFGVTLHDPSLVGLMERMGFAITTFDGHHATGAGLPAVAGTLGNALFEYIPFIILLFSLFCISGGIAVQGDIPSNPRTNTLILAIGGVLASFIGTTGASVVLIRPILRANAERKRVAHTVVFFIFIVSNIGGCLLPIGDPPLFLGYLSGVPFFWTLRLWAPWAFMLAVLLMIYFVWDTLAWRSESTQVRARVRVRSEPIRVLGRINSLWLLLVVVVVATVIPGRRFPGTNILIPPFLREALELVLVGLSFATTPRAIREANEFRFTAIAEVACLFIGIFVTMQIPIEILNARGEELRLDEAWEFFWATGLLSGFLDNAPTYVVFFHAATVAEFAGRADILMLPEATYVPQPLLVAVSLGAVFMGALTYIGNGPNFMIRSIAAERGVRMPTFFGYLLYSGAVLIPLFVIVTILFL